MRARIDSKETNRMEQETLKFQVGNSVVSSYKRLAYTPWHAIAEFIDNSTQSFFDNREVLTKASNKAGLPRPLKVVIEYDSKEEYFRVEDNAMGMSFDELKHALHVAEPPANTNGRSQFGMGLKTAASWLGNNWKIVTKKYGETYEYSVVVDVNKIAAGENNLSYETRSEGVDQNDHYTIITITDHNKKFQTRTLGKISQFLRSMYRQDFRAATLTLLWKGEVLDWKEIDHRLARDKNGNPYKRTFDFCIGTDSEDPQDVKNLRVHGWIGVLEKGKRRDAGLTVFHADRVIMGWPNAYRPEALYGDERNDLLNQRLLGEIHLDDLLVSHTKDDIQWMGDQEEQLEGELKRLFLDYMRFANESRRGKEDSRGPSSKETDIAVSELEEELSSTELADAVNLEPMLTKELVDEVVNAAIERTKETSQPRFTIQIGPITVYLYLQTDMSINDAYLTVEAAKANEVIVVVNENHPHWYQIRGAEGVLNYLRHCVYDGIAEWKARGRLSTIDPDTIKILKDGFLRVPMEIEKHQE